MAKTTSTKSKQLKRYKIQVNQLGKEKNLIDRKRRSLPKLHAKYTNQMETINNKIHMLLNKIDSVKKTR